MTSPTIDYSLVEKLAIVHTVDSIIHADGTIHSKEITAFCELMKRIDFDSNSILQARNIAPGQVQLILRDMPYAKKEALALILNEMAICDGFVHKSETALMETIFTSMGMVEEAQH